MTFFPIPWYFIILLLLLVVLLTSLGAISGFSGSVFIVPLFSIILLPFNIPFTTIVGCSAAGCFFNGLVASIINIKNKEIDWVLAVIFEAPTTVGVFLGAFLTSKIDERITTSFFTAFALVLAIVLFIRIYRKKKKSNICDEDETVAVCKRMPSDQGEDKTPKKTPKDIRKEKRKKKREQKRKKPVLTRIAQFGPQWKINKEDYSYTVNVLILVVAALSIGFLAGMVGCGGGGAKAPVLISGFVVPPVIAVSTGMLMTTITLLVSGSMHIALGHFALWLWLIIIIGSIIGSLIGSKLKNNFSSNVLQIIMASTLMAIAILLLVKTWVGF